MGSKGRKAVGLVFALLGVLLTLGSLFITWFMIVYGIPLLIIGIVIFFNNSEDNIEQRKDLNKSSTKKSKK